MRFYVPTLCHFIYKMMKVPQYNSNVRTVHWVFLEIIRTKKILCFLVGAYLFFTLQFGKSVCNLQCIYVFYWTDFKHHVAWLATVELMFICVRGIFFYKRIDHWLMWNQYLTWNTFFALFFFFCLLNIMDSK